MSTGFKLKAKHGGRRIAALMDISGKDSVFVGVIKNVNYPGSKHSVAEVAWYNEFGTSRIPERPFLRWTLSDHNGYFPELGKALLSALRHPQTDYKKYLRAVGVIAAADVRATIMNATFEPNSENTIAKKGSSRPLIDTGRLRQAITSALVESA